MEVVVDYLDGDPDFPLIVGCVYNEDNLPPYELPKDKTQAGVKSDSTKGHHGYNELMFEDKKGSELFRMHAQKDQLVLVNNNVTETVGGDETITVGTETSGGNFTLNAVKKMTINVGPKEMPLSQVIMDMESITLKYGPEGLFSQIVMNAAGITMNAMGGLSSVSIQPTGVTIIAPTVTVTAMATVDVMAPTVTVGAVLNTPVLNAGAGTVGGLPLV